jgi:cytochrome oxidase Cu insertion factor (SCO1/SenC/PrrC family)
MQRPWIWSALAGAFLLGACQGAPAALSGGRPGSSVPAVTLKVGDVAPDFTLPDQNRQEVRLSQFRGKPVQVAFYVWAFSGG